MTDDGDEAGLPACFIIGPIGDAHAEIGSEDRTVYEQAIQVLEQVLQPACVILGLRLVRADKMGRAGEIPEQVCRMVRDSEVVVADLSGGNPNVMYELGLRHTLQKLTVQLGEVGRLPFDVQAIRTIQFRRSEGGLIEARDALIALLRDGLAGNFDPVTATRVWSEGREHTVESAETTPEAEDPGVLERLVGMEEALPDVIVTMQQVTAVSESLTAKMNETQAEVEASNARQASAADRLNIATRFAKELETSAIELEELAETYEVQMRAIDPGVSVILANLEEDPSQVGGDILEYLSTLVDLGPVFNEFQEATSKNAQATTELGKLAIALRKPSRRYSDAILRISRAGVVTGNWATRAARLLAAP